jgi:hypothetical protein
VGLTPTPNGHLLGATRVGGDFSNGGIFLISTNPPASYSVVHNFFGGLDGARSRGPLLRGSGNVYYGTTFGGGNNGRGTIYRMLLPTPN